MMTAQEAFSEQLPEITSRARAVSIRTPDREDKIAELVAMVWRNFRSAHQSGNDKLTPYTSVVYANRNWIAGRRFASTPRRDITYTGKPMFMDNFDELESLARRPSLNPAVSVSFMLDMQTIQGTMTARQAQVLSGLLEGQTCAEIGRSLGVSTPCITSTRTCLAKRLHRFGFGPHPDTLKKAGRGRKSNKDAKKADRQLCAVEF